jgi:hypothetical protein
MKVKMLYYFLLFSVMASSCLVPRREKKAFTADSWCYDPSVEPSKKIMYDGYYASKYYDCVFYSDGMWIGGLDPQRSTIVDKIDWYNEYGINLWGVYRVFDDTVKVRFLNAPYIPSNTWHVWYLIMEDLTLKEIIRTPDFPITKAMIEAPPRTEYFMKQKLVFVQSMRIPDMNLSWFKKSKWLWCDKAAYKKWAAIHKPSKKRKKRS